MRVGASAAALVLVTALGGYAKERPNVLLITVDDMNWDSVGVYGAEIPDLTPNIDRLASEGLRFEHAHVTIAICQPTRAVWMTGRYPHNSGAFGFDEIRPDVPTLVEALRDAGFRTGLMAKHGHVVPSRAEAWTEIVPARELANGRSPELYYERALRFMSAAREAGEPFFLMANSQDPHRPFAASEAEARQQRTDAASENHQYGGGFPPAELAFDPRKIPVPGFLPDLPDVRVELAQYYTSVKRADATTGAVLRALDDAGLAEDTLVMFLSDHGIAVPFAKTNVWMHSTRTPWIVRWPGVVDANAVDERHVVSGIDLAPTLLDALGLPALPGADGRSFLGALRGEELDGFDFAFTHMNVTIAPEWYPMRSIVGRRYGYIYNAWADGTKEFFNNSMRGLTFPAMAEAAGRDPAVAARVEHLLYRSKEELYDYRTDPDALENLADDPAYASVLADHRQTMLEQMRATGDPELEGYELYLRPPNVVLWPIVSGEAGATTPHDVFYYYWPDELRAVRSGKWKLHLPHAYDSILGAELATPTFHGVYARAEMSLSLFDVDADPGETTDAAAGHPRVVERLLELAEKARAELGDALTGRAGSGVRAPGTLDRWHLPSSAFSREACDVVWTIRLC